MFDMAPKPIIAEAALRDKAMNMRIPFEIPAERMQNHNETRSKVFGMIHFRKHMGNNTVDRMKKAVAQRTVIQKESTEILINGKSGCGNEKGRI